MFDLTDKKYHHFVSGRKTLCRAYCDKCNADRGYLLFKKSNANLRCKACGTRSQYDPTEKEIKDIINVDFNDFIVDKYNKRRYMCKCLSCNTSRGYKFRHNFNKLCNKCSQIGQIKSIKTRIRIAAIHQGISESDFIDFKTPDKKIQRLKFDKSKLASECFKIKDFTCKVCSKRGGNLNAHHLNSWHAYPEQRFELTNLVCLCTSCHSKFHKKFGFKYNTKEQFEEFKL